MKRTNFVTRLVSILLFIALLSYLGVYLIRSMSKDIRTAPAVAVEIYDSITATGIIARQEQIITSNETYLSINADNGQMVASGGVVAMAYSNETALARAGQIRQLQLQRQYILAARSVSSSDTALTKREESIQNSITQLAASAARHEPDGISAATFSLSSTLLENTGVGVSDDDLAAINSEIDRLNLTSASDTTPIKAPISGLFFSSVDGFEHITPEFVTDIKPSVLRELMTQAQETGANSIGKVASPLSWYFAALISQEDAARLKVGERATLDFVRYCSGTITAVLVSMNLSDDDCAVTFRCTANAEEMLYVRNVSAEIVFESHTGIRVPKEAVYSEENPKENKTDEDPDTLYYVYTVTGLQAEKKYINITWETSEFYIAEISAEKADALRVGNEIILTKDAVSDGMILE